MNTSIPEAQAKRSHKKPSLKKNFSYTILYRISTIIIPIITTPYVSRVLGSEMTGIYAYTYTIAWYFVIFGMFGFENHGNRQIATVRDNQQKLNQSFSALFGLQIITSSIATIGYLGYMLWFCKEYYLEAWISSLYVLSVFLNISWLFYGLEQFKTTALRTIAARTLGLILIFVFVHDKSDLWKYVLILAASEVFNQVVLWFHVHKYVSFVRVSFKEIMAHLKPCAILFLPIVLIQIYRLTNTLLLGNLGTMEEVGFYTYADRLTEMPFHIITAIGIVMLPRTTNLVAKGEHEKSRQYMGISMRYNTVFACAVTFGMIAVSTEFCVLFLGEEYRPCAPLICIIAPMLIVRAWANVARTQFLMPYHKDKEYIISLAVGVIFNLTLNPILIPRIGAAGAAFATLAAESSVATTQVLFTLKVIPIKQYLVPNFPFILIGLFMMVTLMAINHFLAMNWFNFVMLIIIGILLYSSLSILYLIKIKDERILKIVKR